MPRLIIFFLIFNILILFSSFTQERGVALSQELSDRNTRGLRVVMLSPSNPAIIRCIEQDDSIAMHKTSNTQPRTISKFPPLP